MLTFELTYTAFATATLALPEDRTWADIQRWWIKWETFYCIFRDGTSYEAPLVTDPEVSLKRPDHVTVRDACDCTLDCLD